MIHSILAIIALVNSPQLQTPGKMSLGMKNTRITPWIIEKSKKSQKNGCPILDTLVSGSPIIQDGKLVGAVTHVLVNDPTTGYGIFIENMLDAAA